MKSKSKLLASTEKRKAAKRPAAGSSSMLQVLDLYRQKHSHDQILAADPILNAELHHHIAKNHQQK